jgi:GT2 family glycosyltransferase
MRYVTVVPWRPGEFRREMNWTITKPYLEKLGWPIFTGDAKGPWSRARAVNAAAREAGDWDVMLISDADTIGDPDLINAAATIAFRRNGAIRPHDKLWMLTPEQTADFRRFGRHGTIINFKTKCNPGGGLLVVSRVAWDTVGGYDESFVDWGHEDSHLNTRLLAETYWDMLEGSAYHLWHPRNTAKNAQILANKKRMRLIQMQYGEVIARESRERGWDVGAYL